MGKATRWFKGLFGINSAKKTPIQVEIGGSGAEATRFNKHAIAVAVATASAADAAVVAAQAAAEVVRLTCRERNRFNHKLIAGAVTIQTYFRGYLARKALRALKGVVKIQALVRGYLVRKQAVATLHGIEALFRAQVAVKSKRASDRLKRGPVQPDPLNCARLSMGEFRGGTKAKEYYNVPLSAVRSRRLSASYELRTLEPRVDKDIVKSGRTRLVRNATFSELEKDPSSYQVLPSRFQHHFQSHCEFPPCHHKCCHDFHDKEWLFASVHETTLFSNFGCRPCAEMLQKLYYNYPNYMAKTMSSNAKVRAQSAPKQRPEPNGERSGVSERKRRIVEGRNSVCGGRIKTSSSYVQQAFNLKNVLMTQHGMLSL